MCNCTSVTHHGHVCLCTRPLKLEVGKTYVTTGSGNVKIIANEDGLFIGLRLRANTSIPVDLWAYESDGKRSGAANYLPSTTITREYHEPKVTKKDVILYNYIPFGLDHRNTVVLEVGEKMSVSSPENWREISRQTVTFTE